MRGSAPRKRTPLPTLLVWLAALALATLAAACMESSPEGDTAEQDGGGATDGEGDGAAEGDAAAEDYPSQRLDWTIAFGPGGGNDIMSRTLIEILEAEELYTEPIVAENREGGSGANGWGYLYNQAGNPYGISTTSGSFITTPLQADTPWQPTDFTPIALLATDDLVLTVRSDAGIEDIDQFVEQAKQDPPSIGGIGAVNVDFIAPTLLASDAGFEFDYVSFNDAGALLTALLSGSLDAMMVNPGEVMGQIEAGDIVALAHTGVETPEALGDVPTFTDAGYDVQISMPRGLILPPDVDEGVQQWWIEAMEQVVETEAWDQYLQENLLTENIQYGEDLEAFLEETQGTFEKILREEGAID